MRHVPVEHAGNATDSVEEAAAVVDLVRDLLEGGATWTDRHGDEHPMGLADIVIVAPYNAHVAAIEKAFAAADMGDPFVGTVDKFQGQERPVSIYAMGTSTPEDAPRGTEFLYSLNRLNVATSRARCVAAVVCSPPCCGSAAGRRARCSWRTACAWRSRPRPAEAARTGSPRRSGRRRDDSSSLNMRRPGSRGGRGRGRGEPPQSLRAWT